MKTFTYSFLLLSGLLLLSIQAIPQVAINSDSTAPANSAMLDVKASDKGVLIPRMTFAQRNAISSPEEGLMVYCTDCTVSGTGTLCIFREGQWVNCLWECPVPATPLVAVHYPQPRQVQWNWLPAPIAKGYKWSTLPDYSVAADLGAVTSFTETGLDCDTAYTRYLWAYNDCGACIVPLILNDSTLSCDWACGTDLIVNHVSGTVAPLTGVITYPTAGNIPGVESKCWIIRNLGASQAAVTADDTSAASAGWYFQFNRSQGFFHDGVSRIPAVSWNNTVYENSNWQSDLDPCLHELGSGWRLPTRSEWENADAAGGWSGLNDSWSSELMIHAAGRLLNSDGSLNNRGVAGYFWSSTQYSNSAGWSLGTSIAGCYMFSNYVKASGFPVRCLKD